MKCDKCEKEAMLHYVSEVNGEKREYRLCADCAKAEGFGNMLSFRPRPMSDVFFSRPTGFMEGFFANPFSMFSDGFFGGRMLAPSLVMPRVMIKVDGERAPEAAQVDAAQVDAAQTDTTQTAPEKTDNIPEDAGEEIRAKRELIQLRQEMKNAVEAEEFEKAAELRDKIRQLEK